MKTRAYWAATILGPASFAIVAPGFPRLKEWAYAGFFFDLTGAAATRAFVGDGVVDIIAPLAFLALVAASWALQPARHVVAQGFSPAFSAALKGCATAGMSKPL